MSNKEINALDPEDIGLQQVMGNKFQDGTRKPMVEPFSNESTNTTQPKKMAQLAEISGRVSIEETKRNVMCNLTITADDGEVVTYALPYSAGIKVKHSCSYRANVSQVSNCQLYCVVVFHKLVKYPLL